MICTLQLALHSYYCAENTDIYYRRTSERKKRIARPRPAPEKWKKI